MVLRGAKVSEHADNVRAVCAAPPVRDQHILGLDVSMYDAEAVNVGEGGGELAAGAARELDVAEWVGGTRRLVDVGAERRVEERQYLHEQAALAVEEVGLELDDAVRVGLGGPEAQHEGQLARAAVPARHCLERHRAGTLPPARSAHRPHNDAIGASPDDLLDGEARTVQRPARERRRGRSQLAERDPAPLAAGGVEARLDRRLHTVRGPGARGPCCHCHSRHTDCLFDRRRGGLYHERSRKNRLQSITVGL